MRFHIPGPALGYTISPDPSFPHAHAVMRMRACACTEGAGYQTTGVQRKVLLTHDDNATAVLENKWWKGMLLLPWANRIAYVRSSEFCVIRYILADFQ